MGRFRAILFLSTLFMVCFTIAAWSAKLPFQPHSRGFPATETESVIGKISSIGDAEFSLDIVKNQKVNTIQFSVDGSTQVQGRLRVGSQATVEFHMNGDKMIATRVIVTPASGIGLY